MIIKKLDGFRGIFSLMIVFFHTSDEVLPKFMTSFYLTRESYIFVDFFFVLSGFVITLNYYNLKSYDGLKTYLKKRLIRLYPLLIFSSIITLVLSLIFLKELNLIGFFNSISLLNSTPVPNLFYSVLTGSNTIMNLYNGMYSPSWSISSEIITYMFFGVITVYFLNQKKLLFIILILLSFFFCFMKGGYWSFTAGLGVFRGIVSFFIGSLTFLYGRNFNNLKSNNSLIEIISIIGFLILTLYHSNLESIEKEIFGMVTLPIYFGGLIFLFSKSNGLISSLLESKILQFLGMISYSIYLNHSIFVNLFEVVNDKYTNNLTFYFMILFIIGYSYLTFKTIELNGGKWLRKKLIQVDSSNNKN
jgi:peptidoglycan/LPS O-acetylase OafA/YrhL